MPYVGDDVHQPRKRRWEEDENEIYRLYSSPEKQPAAFYLLNPPLQSPDAAAAAATAAALATTAQDRMQARKFLPLSKRPRTDEDDVHIHGGDPSPAHRQRTLQSRALQDHNHHNHQKQQQLPPSGANKTPPRTGGATLTPCHICHRRPTKKSDLDSFAECQGCGERACFVCIRECQGWNANDVASALSQEREASSTSFHMDDAADDPQANNGHDRQQQQQHHHHQAAPPPDIAHERRSAPDETGGSKSGKGWNAGGHRAMVCSRCCIEKGAEGEVVCLGCLSGMEST